MHWLIRMSVSIAQIAPAVRVAVGDAFGLPKGRERDGQDCQCAAPRWDLMKYTIPTFSADLTIMEETAEFLDRVEKWRKTSASDLLLPGMGEICRMISSRIIRRIYRPAVLHRV